MNKFSLKYLVIFCCSFNLFSEGLELDEILRASEFCPVDYEVFFAEGAPNNWAKEGLNPAAWSGLCARFKSKKMFESPGLFNVVGLSVGPVDPDSLSSFVASLELPFLMKNAEWGSLYSGLSRAELLKQSFTDFTNLGPNLALTARGFFGPGMGTLKNCELVFQAATKLPFSDSWNKHFNLLLPVDGNEQKIELFNRTAFLFGINFNVIPKFFRVGGFVELLSPSMSFDQVVPTLKQIFNYATFGAGQKMAELKQQWFPKNENSMQETMVVQKSVELPKFENAGLLTVGAQAEIALARDKLFVGARVKRTQLSFDKKLKDPLKNGTKEVILFARCGRIKLLEWLEFPEVGVNYSMFFSSANWQQERSALGLFATYRF